ncbi:hypothetical protein AXG93_1660s1340 [Marchantia polymorpha subsp. ruderalis]|uniref:Uncharacterized protein n=1 Tax=Marchantia polymorpha subsp. ruderalis TaxID=1480154 RepID=A0A176VTD5_MARPO|nr:hypothetical protein AXG93_1660s1340 [Marchantia polymorpha subsp. ruderalis]
MNDDLGDGELGGCASCVLPAFGASADVVMEGYGGEGLADSEVALDPGANAEDLVLDSIGEDLFIFTLPILPGISIGSTPSGHIHSLQLFQNEGFESELPAQPIKQRMRSANSTNVQP